MSYREKYLDWFRRNGGLISQAPAESAVCDGARFFFHSCMQDIGNGYRGSWGTRL